MIVSFHCEFCGKEFDRPVTSGHKRKCPEFLAANPDRKPLACLCGHKSTSLTQMKRHRKDCQAWQSRDKNAVALERIKSTFQKKYGDDVTNALMVPGAAEKKAATITERYGAENVFCKKSTLYKQVQSHWDGKDRTAHLPKDNFARPEIKEKIRQTNLEKYGVENPSQVPEIRAKQLATNLERYGDEQTLRVPEIREKGRQTNIAQFGVPDPAQAPEVQEKIKQTNLVRYGVEWTTQDSKTKSSMNESLRRFMSIESNRLIYSLTHNEESYRSTCMKKYGVPHPMMNPEYARKHLEHSRRAGPNKPELAFNKLYPFFCFSGNGSFWKLIPSVQNNRNPDFCFPVYPKQDGSPSFKRVTHVVEILGDYWHGKDKTGESNKVHARKIINQWNEVGLKCLTVWEHELKDDLQILDDRVRNFLAVNV